jgi:hypothetical protein
MSQHNNLLLKATLNTFNLILHGDYYLLGFDDMFLRRDFTVLT